MCVYRKGDENWKTTLTTIQTNEIIRLENLVDVQQILSL